MVERVIGCLKSAGAVGVPLRPLDEPAVELIAADITGAVPDGPLMEVSLAARGNPFLLVELLRSLMSEQLIRAEVGTIKLVGGGLPARFRRVVRSRMEQLPTAARLVVDVRQIQLNASP